MFNVLVAHRGGNVWAPGLEFAHTSGAIHEGSKGVQEPTSFSCVQADCAEPVPFHYTLSWEMTRTTSS